MRFTRTFVSLVACAAFATVPTFAQRGPNPHPPVVHPNPPHGAATPAVHPTPTTVPTMIAANPALATRLQPLLPPNLTLAMAATGFKNQGQFIAALHVAHNLNIPFAQLKAQMTGTNPVSLGQAIHRLQPSANANTAAKTAEETAKADVTATSSSGKSTGDKSDR